MGMTFWQLCTLKNTPQHNALGSSTHTGTITNVGIFMQAVDFALTHTHTHTLLGEHAVTSLALFSFFCTHTLTHTVLSSGLCIVSRVKPTKVSYLDLCVLY